MHTSPRLSRRSVVDVNLPFREERSQNLALKHALVKCHPKPFLSRNKGLRGARGSGDVKPPHFLAQIVRTPGVVVKVHGSSTYLRGTMVDMGAAGVAANNSSVTHEATPGITIKVLTFPRIRVPRIAIRTIGHQLSSG